MNNANASYLSDRPVNYNLRERDRNKSVILNTADLNERDFFIRNLYKRIY